MPTKITSKQTEPRIFLFYEAELTVGLCVKVWQVFFDVQVQHRSVCVVVQYFNGEHNVVNIQGVLHGDILPMLYIASPVIFQRALQQGQQVATATSGNCWW